MRGARGTEKLKLHGRVRQKSCRLKKDWPIERLSFTVAQPAKCCINIWLMAACPPWNHGLLNALRELGFNAGTHLMTTCPAPQRARMPRSYGLHRPIGQQHVRWRLAAVVLVPLLARANKDQRSLAATGYRQRRHGALDHEAQLAAILGLSRTDGMVVRACGGKPRRTAWLLVVARWRRSLVFISCTDPEAPPPPKPPPPPRAVAPPPPPNPPLRAIRLPCVPPANT